MRLNGQPPANSPNAGEAGTETRCECGNMMGLITSRGIELKCRRCKRIHTVSFSWLSEWLGSARAASRMFQVMLAGCEPEQLSRKEEMER